MPIRLLFVYQHGVWWVWDSCQWPHKFIVCLSAWRVMSVGQLSVASQDDMRTAVSWNLLYFSGAGRPACLPTDAYHEFTIDHQGGLPWYRLAVWHWPVSQYQTSRSWECLFLILPLLHTPPLFDFSSYHRHNQRPCCSGRGCVPDCIGECFVYFRLACWMKIWLSIMNQLIHIRLSIQLIHIRLSITENIRKQHP